jgi:hypothetical protein
MGRPVRTFGGLRKPLAGGGDNRSVTVTFDYQGELRTVVAPSRKAAFADAAARWGWGWDGEPVVSSPESIYRDLTGETKLHRGQDFGAHSRGVANRERARRTGQPHA